MSGKRELIVLYVEDDFWVAKPMIEALVGRGYKVIHVESATQALESMKACSFGAVVTDWNLLRGETGASVVEAAEAAGIPVRICSGLLETAKWSHLWIAKGYPEQIFAFLALVREG